MLNIVLHIAYDGTRYFGWQKTKAGPNIEGILQAVLEKILQQPIALQAASRTDTGVHAQGQVVNFLTSHLTCSLDRLRHSLNQLLPSDIVVLNSATACPSFHPTLDCVGKEYRYSLCLGPVQLPQHRLYSWHYPYDLNIPMMKEAATLLTGTHSFSAFCNAKKNSSYEHYYRTIRRIVLEVANNQLQFQIEGDNFLYKMVRNLVGTMVYVGRGKIALNEVSELLSHGDRKRAGITAPAHGLSLYQVFYKRVHA